MMSVTHAAIAVCTTTLAIGTANPFVLLVAAIGSQLPDVDSTESYTGRMLFPLARWLEERYPHRTLTHSFLASGLVGLVGLPLWFVHWHYWAALALGYFCAWFSDAFTKAGVAAFWPNPARLVIPGNPRVRLDTRSPAEYWILAIAVCLTIAATNLISAGGITQQFALSFFRDTATAVEMFRKYGAEQAIVVEVRGIHTHTAQAIWGRYTVIDATEQDLIAEDGAGKLYKIGSAQDGQIRPTGVVTHLGERRSLRVQEVALRQMLVGDWANRLPQNAYLSGVLVLDDLEQVQLPLEIQQYPTLRKVGGQIELKHARPGDVVAALADFWILQGKVVVKVRG